MSDPNKRLGSEETGGSEAVRSHPYFATVDWDNLITKTPPPFKPYLPPVVENQLFIAITIFQMI